MQKKSLLSKKSASLIKRLFDETNPLPKFWLLIVLIIGFAGFGYSGKYLYQNVYLNPENIFYETVSNNLATSSVFRSIEQSSDGNSNIQSSYLALSPDPLVHTSALVEQIDQNRQKSTIITESYGTKKTDYTRYTSINVPKTETADYSKIVGLWTKRESGDDSSNAQFLNQNSFVLIPFGKFNAMQRERIINNFKSNNTYKLSNSKIVYQSGRPILESSVAINPRQLVLFMNDYAKGTGIGDASELDATNYEDQNNYIINVKIDATSRHLLEIKYSDGQRVEKYGSYGFRQKTEIPSKTIPADELQKLVKKS